MNNKYINRSKISEAKMRLFVRLFALDLNASQIASITGLNRNTVNRLLTGLRQRLVLLCLEEQESSVREGKMHPLPPLPCPNATDAATGQPLPECPQYIGLKKQNGCIRIGGVPLPQSGRDDTARGVCQHSSELEKIACSQGYDGLVDIYARKFTRIPRTIPPESSCSRCTHIDELESFWGFIKVRLIRFRGLPHKTLGPHLKECEFRFNHRQEDMYLLLLQELRKRPLF